MCGHFYGIENLNNISLVPHAIFFASLKITNKDNF